MGKLAGAVFAALCLAALFATPALATYPGATGQIAFSRAQAGGAPVSDIWVALRSGKQRRLTRTPLIDETDPAYSPNGRLIVYSRRPQGEDADVWIMRANGRGKRPLADGRLNEFQASFFPTGRAVVYTAYDGEDDYWTVRSIRIDGSEEVTQIAGAWYPVVSPDGRWLAYAVIRNGITGGVHLRSLPIGEAPERYRRLRTGNAQALDFAPNGGSIAYASARRCRHPEDSRFALFKVALRSGRVTLLRRSCEREFVDPAWSPDGRRIAFAIKRQVGIPGTGAGMRLNLAVMSRSGRILPAAPRHRAGMNDIGPAWRPR